VLVGFVLGHRTTDDLDLFTTDDATIRKLGLDIVARVGPLCSARANASNTGPDTSCTWFGSTLSAFGAEVRRCQMKVPRASQGAYRCATTQSDRRRTGR
jgi:hypothetical protein